MLIDLSDMHINIFGIGIHVYSKSHVFFKFCNRTLFLAITVYAVRLYAHIFVCVLIVTYPISVMKGAIIFSILIM